MTKNSTSQSCATMCWIVAAVAGLIMLFLLWNMSAFVAVVVGLAVAIGGAFALRAMFCASIDAAQPAAGATPVATPAAPAAKPAAPQPAAAAPKAEAAGTSAVVSAPATPAAGIAEIPAAAPKPKAKAKTKAKEPKAKEPKVKAAAKAKAKAADKTSDKPAKAAKVAKKAAAPKAEAKPAKAPVAANGKPELRTAPRDSGPDDLKMIKGVGPKLEIELHKTGVYHFDQIAAWRAKEVKWMDANLDGVRNRVSRDEWVKQAKILAKGEATEFSARVKKGDVY